MSTFDTLIIGEVALDTNVDYDGTTVQAIGGAVYYSGFAAANIGHRTAVLPKADMTAEELQARLDNWAAVKGWRSVEDPAGSETREIAGRMCTSVNSARGRMRSYMKHRSDEFVGVEDKRGRK